jgi:hypothetical protein
VHVLGEGLAMALPGHEVVQQGKRAGEGPAIQTLTKDVQSCCDAVGASSGDALDPLVSTLVLVGNTQQECVSVILGLLV